MGPDPPPAVPGGVDVVWIPVVSVSPIDGASLEVLSRLAGAESIAFTSPRGPRVLREDSIRHSVYDRVRSLMASRRRAVIGPETGRSLYESFGLPWDIMPTSYRGEALAVEIARLGLASVVIARSRVGEKGIVRVLERSGIAFYDVPIYEVVVDKSRVLEAARAIESGEVGVAAFTSSSIARAVCGELGGRRPAAVLAAIGSTTARAVRDLCGVEPLIPENSSYYHLVKKAVEFCSG
jgi:uroporphyrinogen-III synthase